MSKEEVFKVLDEHKKCEYEDHSVLVPVLDYMKANDPATYDSFRRLLNRQYLSLGAEIASELIDRRQTKLEF